MQLNEFAENDPEEISVDAESVLNIAKAVPENFLDEEPPAKTLWAI